MSKKVSTTDEWVDAAIKHMDCIPEDEKYNFVHELIFNLALFGGYSGYEMIGILELVKADLLVSLQNPPDLDDDD